MSGFGKNPASTGDDAWRQNLLKIIFQKREPTLPNSEPKIVNRCSLSLSTDFQELLKEKKVAKTQNNPRQEQNFEHYDITMMDDEPINNTQFANESFEALELMCEKTGSDPDSTLFKYLHSDNRQEVLANAKSRAGSTNSTQELDALDAESAALQRMLKDLNMVDMDDQLVNESPLKGVECTQLEDIEAPSRLWDSTVIGVETSPVKMIGLMRPSTILEGCEDDSLAQSDISSQFSYQTAAVKNEHSATASSCYETANDQSAATSHDAHDEDVNDYDGGQCADVDNLFYAALAKMKPVLMKDEREELLQDLHETVNLIDLEATFSAANKSIEKTITTTESKDLNDESVIEILSDDDDKDNEEPLLNNTPCVKEEKLSISKHTLEMSGLSPLKQEERKSNTNYTQQNENKENEESLHFNDTMEEVEYMMRKGLEYMAAKVAQSTAETSTQIDTIKTNNESTKTLTKQHTFLLSPKQITGKPSNVQKVKPLVSSNVNSPRKMKTVTPNKVYTGGFSTTSAKINSPKISSQANAAKPNKKGLLIDFNREPQVPFFKQPSGIPTLRQKELKQPYAHIVSPIRAYVQNTATAPLMTSLKAKNSNADVLNAAGFRQAVHDSRQHQPEFGAKIMSANGDKIPGVPMNVNLLPSKAYISSEFKHIVDERTPVTIPGGQKMQKLLESAVATTVLRHDGKLKVPGGLDGHAASRLPRPREQHSLADLSVMSGDVSLYTIKDAQKF